MSRATEAFSFNRWLECGACLHVCTLCEQDYIITPPACIWPLPKQAHPGNGILSTDTILESRRGISGVMLQALKWLQGTGSKTPGSHSCICAFQDRIVCEPMDHSTGRRTLDSGVSRTSSNALTAGSVTFLRSFLTKLDGSFRKRVCFSGLPKHAS